MSKKHKPRKTEPQEAALQAAVPQEPGPEKPASKWDQPQAVDRLDAAFGGRVGELLPTWEELPACYRNANSRRPSVQFVEDWFYTGLNGLQCEPRPGVDVHKALMHIRACLTSFEPAQEHKTGGVAFLVDHFFVRASASGRTYEFELEP